MRKVLDVLTVVHISGKIDMNRLNTFLGLMVLIYLPRLMKIDYIEYSYMNIHKTVTILR